MTFRNLLLTIGCAAAALASPPGRTASPEVSASVVWGARAYWNTWQPRAPVNTRGHAPVQLARGGSGHANRV